MSNDVNNIMPTDSELEILQLLWLYGESSVRAINDALNEKREVGYTTTLKIMQIMNDKGFVTRNTDSKVHLYKAKYQETKVKNKLMSNFISNAFNGSTKDLIMAALGNHKATKEELNEIKNLISQIENKK